MFINHFKQLFCGNSVDERVGDGCRDGLSGDGDSSNLHRLSALGIGLSIDQKQLLDAPFMEEEIRVAIFQMGRMKAPGPDGFVAGFYQKNWDWVGAEVTRMVMAFLHSGTLLRELNQSAEEIKWFAGTRVW
ncbi:hypothetical protein Vadar_003107 [Vaccinium darrowii]|uniref:Uncharacterized protein n=1 Tax=Vaccinium darrowii TaxID=229202 RepID=A0ACB7WYS2_9ERIC|nr:hypothetical protein Vadar_007675 [Vaccinium darrowii]KAH7845114.1 hypothetical protein Vadar_003107 [Vaccinium darrowii]